MTSEDKLGVLYLEAHRIRKLYALLGDSAFLSISNQHVAGQKLTAHDHVTIETLYNELIGKPEPIVHLGFGQVAVEKLRDELARPQPAAPTVYLEGASRAIGTVLAQIWQDESLFSQEKFGDDTERGPIGPLNHILEEVVEAVDNPTEIEEYADILLLLLDATRRGGFTLQGLIEAARKKLTENIERTWPLRAVQDMNEPVKHDREAT